jgi:phosphoglycerol transferase MdoB-like AlkP superfamily enzyme
MADYLQVQQPDSSKLNFTRSFPASAATTKPNIVLVICESFSAYKSSMYGNPLNTTPYFNQLCKEGVFFDRCFTPSYGTARGVWATVTGIPDVENPRTASRNPGAVDQRSIINDFTGYNNFYFLGGSANWANIRGLLTNNIRDLELYEQDDYSAKKIDVWGISDKNLFLESNKVLKEQKAPFFAIIQTADNHRPYTIPAEDKAEFKLLSMPDDSLHAYGFESLDEMNAFRYTDFCFQKFMEAAKKETYFNNTLFVFVGDHGIGGNAHAMFPKAWTDQGFTAYHVPLLFYAPGLLKPQRIHDVCSQVDVLPTVATLTGVGYSNTALGRALPITGADSTHQPYAFIINPDLRSIGMMNNDYYYSRSLKSGKEVFVSITGNEAVSANETTKKIRTQLQRLTDANFETAKYLLLNNRKR